MVDRRSLLLKHIDVSEQGIEIAPYFNPTLAKRDGYRVLTVDVFDTATLRQNALADPGVPDDRIAEIEEVDIVCDASSLGQAVTGLGKQGQFGYVLSSHNFEHLPDPIRFLQGCSIALAPGGVLSMAVPDGRACFDHFRMPTRLSDWLQAYHGQRSQPSPETIFDSLSNLAQYGRGGNLAVGCDISLDDPRHFQPMNDLAAAYAEYLERISSPQPYRDTHCTVTFGAALENMLWDLRFLGLVDLEIIEVTETLGQEFFVHMRKPVTSAPVDSKAFYAARAVRLRKVVDGLGTAGFGRPGPGQSAVSLTAQRAVRRSKSFIERLLPTGTVASIRSWNRRRKERRH
ncbi:adenine phosphoribosyltransferase [Tabrizicola flagellatus]|uniref:adenine phosphoribosyltransferase n=1 Tax=Tabrizicola flagellatus TaxID=2593021 RepID=UPI0011F0A57D|nr:adenine phosphoribosyltransferase [Tabrizicola flagellatus]